MRGMTNCVCHEHWQAAAIVQPAVPAPEGVAAACGLAGCCDSCAAEACSVQRMRPAAVHGWTSVRRRLHLMPKHSVSGCIGTSKHEHALEIRCTFCHATCIRLQDILP